MARRTRRTRRTTSRKPSTKRKSSTKMEIDPEEKTVTGVSVKAVQNTIDQTGSRFWKPEAGKKYRLRILPPTPIYKGDFAVRQTIHFGFEDSSGSGRTVACLEDYDEDCPICEFIADLELTDGDSDDTKKIINNIRKQTQLLCELLVNGSKKVRLWRMPVGVYRTLAEGLTEEEIGDFTHPKTGRDISLKRKGEGLSTRYTVHFLDRGEIPFTSWKRHRVEIGRILSPRLEAKKLKRMIEKNYE